MVGIAFSRRGMASPPKAGGNAATGNAWIDHGLVVAPVHMDPFGSREPRGYISENERGYITV